MANNRTIEERDKLNPNVALIRKTSPTNAERGWNSQKSRYGEQNTKSHRQLRSVPINKIT